jgi:hypothetical protein
MPGYTSLARRRFNGGGLSDGSLRAFLIPKRRGEFVEEGQCFAEKTRYVKRMGVRFRKMLFDYEHGTAGRQ